jgi:hypothetical protein
LRVQPARHRFHPHLPEEIVWGYDGLLPGPTFVGRINVPSVVRIYPRKPDDDRLYPGIRMLQFRVGGSPTIPDRSRIPDRLRELEPINLAGVTRKRHFEFERRCDQWAAND